MVVGGGSYEYDMDEYLDAAISLHSDIIFIFLYLLEIFAFCDWKTCCSKFIEAWNTKITDMRWLLTGDDQISSDLAV